ncbi:MAG: YdcF family protein [Lachnospiraceae bacterium]|nr:YdcF family protein [Lachnospiraceae bacterium]
MKFDTRDRKPKLYGILAAVAAAAVIITLLVPTGAEAHSLPIAAVVALFILSCIVQLVIAFFLQIRYNPYSYNTIIYAGFSLFLAVLLVLQVLVIVSIVRDPEHYTGEAVLHTLLGSAGVFGLFTFPFVLVFSAALFVSNVSLIRHEGLRPVNILGILLGLLLVGGEVFLFAFNFMVSGSQTEVMIHDIVSNSLSAIYLYFECMIIGTIIADVITATYEPEKDKDFLIILGCAIRKDGTPTPLLSGRIDRALAFAERQEAETGKELRFITSGGQGTDETVSESAAMKAYLLSRGVPESRILEEDRSANTLENMKYSKAIIDALDPQAKVAFSTTNYHVFRSGLSARRVKMRAVGMGAETKWYFWPNAAVREFIGLLTAHRLKQGLILGGMVLFYLVLTLVAYR